MLCRNCNLETVEGAAFCTHCGTPLRLSCESCQAENPQESAYCYACGTSLLAVSAQQAGPPPETPFHPPESYWIEEAYKGEEPFLSKEPVRSGPADSVERSGFWNRFVAVLIDALILAIPHLLVSRFAPDGWDFLSGAGLLRRLLGDMGSHARESGCWG